MSAKIEALVAKHSKLKSSAKSVLLAIARLVPRDRDDGGGVYASVEIIAQQSGWSVDTVQRAFRKARDKGELDIYYNRGPNGTNQYHVRVDALTKRNTDAKSPRASKSPPANCTPSMMRDKGSVFKAGQYNSKTRRKDQPLPDSPDGRAEKATANGYRTCPDCGRYGGRCNCDSQLQAGFDRAMRDTLDAGRPGPAQLASQEALRRA
jgi:Helix-turn-helix domain